MFGKGCRVIDCAASIENFLRKLSMLKTLCVFNDLGSLFQKEIPSRKDWERRERSVITNECALVRRFA